MPLKKPNSRRQNDCVLFQILMKTSKNFFLSILVLLAFLASHGAPANTSETTPVPVRVAIVLGHYPEGLRTPTRIQNARCLKAYGLYKKGLVKKIVVTGGYTRGHISEARMMKIALVAYGVQEDDVVEEPLASTTVENAYYTSRVFEDLGWEKSAVLVTQKGHMWRAKKNFEDSGFRIVKTIEAPMVPENDVFDILPPDKDVPDMPDPFPGVAVVFQPFDSKEPLDYPSPGMARRLRAAAALVRSGKLEKIAVYSEWYTRGPVDIAEMMQVALVSLGVPADKIVLQSRVHYGGFGTMESIFPDRDTLLIAPESVREKAEANPSLVPWLFD